MFAFRRRHPRTPRTSRRRPRRSKARRRSQSDRRTCSEACYHLNPRRGVFVNQRHQQITDKGHYRYCKCAKNRYFSYIFIHFYHQLILSHQEHKHEHTAAADQGEYTRLRKRTAPRHTQHDESGNSRQHGRGGHRLGVESKHARYPFCNHTGYGRNGVAGDYRRPFAAVFDGRQTQQICTDIVDFETVDCKIISLAVLV